MITKVDWKKYDDTPRPKRALTIAIDWDETWTADPDMWKAISDMMKARGHKVYIVTARPSYSIWECEQSGLEVIACAWMPKRETCEARGVRVDVWVDDCPEFI